MTFIDVWVLPWRIPILLSFGFPSVVTKEVAAFLFKLHTVTSRVPFETSEVEMYITI